MENKNSIEHVLENMDKNVVYKTKSSVIKSLSFIGAGLISFAIYTLMEMNPTDVFPHFLFITGTVSIICGIFMFFLRKNHFVSAANHQQLKRTEFYFHVNEREKLVRLLESRNIKEIKTLKPSVSDGLKLRVMATKDGRLCLSQVIAYTTNEYENITDVQYHSNEEALVFAEYLRQRK